MRLDKTNQCCRDEKPHVSSNKRVSQRDVSKCQVLATGDMLLGNLQLFLFTSLITNLINSLLNGFCL